MFIVSGEAGISQTCILSENLLLFTQSKKVIIIEIMKFVQRIKNIFPGSEKRLDIKEETLYRHLATLKELEAYDKGSQKIDTAKLGGLRKYL